MLDQNRIEPFLADKAAAEARRQEAIREAHEAFNRASLVEKARHAAEYESASARWDAVKRNPDVPNYEAARQAFERSKEPANLQAARRVLGEAIRQADEEYRDAVSVIAQRHNITVH